MKDLNKYLLTVAVVSGLMVFYVHTQLLLVRVSYSIDHQIAEREEKLEDCRRLKFETDQLKAPHVLEAKMNDLSLGLNVPKDIRVLRVPVPPVMTPVPIGREGHSPLSNGLADFLGRWIKVAQAETEA